MKKSMNNASFWLTFLYESVIENPKLTKFNFGYLTAKQTWRGLVLFGYLTDKQSWRRLVLFGYLTAKQTWSGLVS